ncbi:DNA repair protein XRCC2-like isoform X2 [Cebidichthys violaceus]|uniref:DNA repair protein XRCC2-like isoform X2 n=1 Tax=Cebidichthys violaceus TaxID=271503 RepID=UPI0035CB8160
MTESGAQLFARLEARRCLKDIEPQMFPEDGGPNHGELVELYGTEGTACSTGLSSSGSDEAALRSCLSRLLVVHCSSSSQLVLTLHFLENSLSSRPGLALLLIDSISAFYWLDRCEGGASIAKQEEKLSKCAELLGRLLRDYRITVFATCHAIRRSYTGPSSSSSSSYDRPYLCRPWQRLVTHRLLCSRQEAANNMAATAGGSERRRRVFTIHCTSSSSSSSSSRTKAYRSSSFYVSDGGVKFI